MSGDTSWLEASGGFDATPVGVTSTVASDAAASGAVEPTSGSGAGSDADSPADGGDDSMFPTMDERTMLQLAEMQLRKLDREYNRALAGVVAPGEGPQAPAGFVEFVGDGDGDGEGDTGSEEEDVDAGYSYFEPQGAAGAEDAGVRPVSPIAEDTKAAIARVMARVVMPDMPVPRLAQAILGSMGTPSSAPATAAVPVAAPAVPPAVDFDSMPSPFEGHIPSQAASTASTEAAVPAAPPHPPATADAAAASATGSEEPALPTVVIIVGMAGSGKTTLMQRVNAEMHMRSAPGYILNLDPAVVHTHYEPNIDIRDSVNYKNVMKDYGLGPNGAIITSLNLFSTHFHEVMAILEKRAPTLKYVFVDTPGQIEVFTWSASGSIITDLLASKFPTVVLFVVDTPRCRNPTTFMSNMLYACSIMYKTRLPFVIAFNKVDAQPCDFAMEWMEDFEAFQAALDVADKEDGDAPGAYMNSLTRSLSLALDEFYSSIRSVGVSAATGEGMQDLFDAILDAGKEYMEFYLPELKDAMARKAGEADAQRDDSLRRLREDIASGDDAPAARPTNARYPFVTMADAVVGGSSLDVDVGVSYDAYDDDDDEEDD